MNIIDTSVQRTDIKSWGTAPEEKKLKSACQEFESFFVYELLKSARKANPKNGLFNNQKETETYTSMMDLEFAKSISKGGGLGLGDILFQQLQSSEKQAGKELKSH
ncbi:flagellar rod assembly protein FlgJ [Candidatus Magnetomorum sp. HK-1]|nr:flagellar rod assembly protein FlgJ [Candidatus Magnetomorum sp. HK-1]